MTTCVECKEVIEGEGTGGMIMLPVHTSHIDKLRKKLEKAGVILGPPVDIKTGEPEDPAENPDTSQGGYG